MVQDDILDQGKVNKLGNKNNQNKRALETVEATANTNEIIMGQDGILDQGHFRSIKFHYCFSRDTKGPRSADLFLQTDS